jgi:hypothetical protein
VSQDIGIALTVHGPGMSKSRLVITAVVVEGGSQSEVARAYGVSQGWSVGWWPGMGRLRSSLGLAVRTVPRPRSRPQRWS